MLAFEGASVDVPLAPRTTLELGGAARSFLEATSEAEAVRAITWADAHGVPLRVLGGGSNLIVPDEGVDGLVVRFPEESAIEARDDGALVRVTVAAGVAWDRVVAWSVDRGLVGLECLSGIPGTAGATPIQNVGAYGQEVADTLVEVRVLDRRTGNIETLPRAACGFAYRHSRFKENPSSYVVLGVTFALSRGAPSLRYGELTRALATVERPTVAAVRETVIALRRTKSMVLDPGDPNRRSAGSFFTNPIVESARAHEVAERAAARGLAADVPTFAAGEGHTKLAAGWLIEKSGLAKGHTRGHFGLSTAHALAVVHHGGGTTRELLAFADAIVAHVEGVFGVRLEREPVLF